MKEESTFNTEEKNIQKKIVVFFCEELGYQLLPKSSPELESTYIQKDLLTTFLTQQRYPDELIKAALKKITYTFQKDKELLPLNKAFYQHLCYGVDVKMGPETKTRTLLLVDWHNPKKNHFHIAEEVRLPNNRIDLVLYLNGIPIVPIELKRATISVEKAIMQNINNQRKQQNVPFFATSQLIMVANPSQGVRYATTQSPAKYYYQWREELMLTPKELKKSPLLAGFYHLCQKERILDIIHNCILFEPGKKFIVRPHQYFPLKAAQKRINEKQGGIIFHTQGAGKSFTMIWIATWLLRNDPDARILLMVDRKSLADQLRSNFQKNDSPVAHTNTAKALFKELSQSTSRIIATLIQKFHTREEEKIFSHFSDQINQLRLTDFRPKGKIYIFVDECHRTHSGKLHQTMKQRLPDALIIGFTGTPLLKKNEKNSINCFGPYIHTYKYHQGVEDGVILDLVYEARNIPQQLQDKVDIDRLFEEKTRNLTPKRKADLKKEWATMQKVHSAHARLARIADDIILDMKTKPDLIAGTTNALLVASSILEAFRYYEILLQKGFSACAVITSYISKTTNGTFSSTPSSQLATSAQRIHNIYTKMLGKYQEKYPDITSKTFEDRIKKIFKEDPATIKLLIVVDKLLTGFDSPATTYLHIDKKMQDHGLFQAVCRVNRIHTEDKQHGSIIDYRDLFKSLEKSIKDYTGEAFENFKNEDVKGLLQDRLIVGKSHLEKARKDYQALLQKIPTPHTKENQREYFCGELDSIKACTETQPKRDELYKIVQQLLRAYADIANQLSAAGYSNAEINTIKEEKSQAEKLMRSIKLASRDQQDISGYDPVMRHILDTYISAERSELISSFSGKTLLQMIQIKGLSNASKQLGIDKTFIFAGLFNNVIREIEKNKHFNPIYYENLSVQLEKLMLKRQLGEINNKIYLKEISKLSEDIKKSPQNASHYPGTIKTPGQKALYDNLDKNEELTLAIDDHIKHKKKDQWKDSQIKTRELKISLANALEKKGILPKNFDQEKKMFIFGLLIPHHEYD